MYVLQRVRQTVGSDFVVHVSIKNMQFVISGCETKLEVRYVLQIGIILD